MVLLPLKILRSCSNHRELLILMLGYTDSVTKKSKPCVPRYVELALAWMREANVPSVVFY